MSTPTTSTRIPTTLLHLRDRRRPLVVELRDWLTCLALTIATLLMLSAFVVGHGVADGTEPAMTPRPGPTIQLVPDPGVRPSPMPGPSIQLPR